MSLMRSSYVILCWCFAAGVFADHWSYNNEKHWPGICQTGEAQSPIDLEESIAIPREFHFLSMHGYGQITSAILKNNGHSAQLTLQNISPPKMHGGGLPGTYQLDHLHFHWQSEHTVNGNRFPLELHLVHFEQKYRNLTEAVGHLHGVAVLGVLFNYAVDDDEDFQPLINILDKIKNDVGKTEQLDNINVKQLMPRDRGGFFRYYGSLTTPGCNEGIIWTVFTDTLPISRNQVESFLTMKTSGNAPLAKNFRSIQPLNGRPLYLRNSGPINPILGYRPSNSSSAQVVSAILLIVCYFFKLIVV
ncbi:carbonic anhydrase 9-like isoform X2 [Anthonomus grandis grandis]|uniref:carbonic anhydrase 9-like isoform X2 n=1 Tax=Anthonomus grandis grandis TaxID=2921223 RepID=UPI0021666013|nr:carbonic anhydrase 9-like isoform X2 [Anthonomus grandis grandis]